MRTRDETGMLAADFNANAERTRGQGGSFSEESERLQGRCLESLPTSYKTPMTPSSAIPDSLLHVNLEGEQKERALLQYL